MANVSSAVTRGIRVDVQSEHLEDRSEPESDQWFFAYHIRISNESAETVRLVSRRWIITDAQGRVQEVRGMGVVGQQPVLRPGESFEYTSGCPLGTPFGAMQGTYRMVTEEGDEFDAEIAPFGLHESAELH